MCSAWLQACPAARASGMGISRPNQFHHQSTPIIASTHLAMATQFFPTMATQAPPLYSRIDCSAHEKGDGWLIRLDQ